LLVVYFFVLTVHRVNFFLLLLNYCKANNYCCESIPILFGSWLRVKGKIVYNFSCFSGIKRHKGNRPPSSLNHQFDGKFCRLQRSVTSFVYFILATKHILLEISRWKNDFFFQDGKIIFFSLCHSSSIVICLVMWNQNRNWNLYFKISV